MLCEQKAASAVFAAIYPDLGKITSNTPALIRSKNKQTLNRVTGASDTRKACKSWPETWRQS